MTLPTVVNKYRNKVLETGFKKSYANLQNAYIMTRAKLGISNIKAVYTAYDVDNEVYIYTGEFYDAFYASLNAVQEIPEYSVLNYSGTRNTNPAGCFTGCPHLKRILPDGSTVGVFINSNNIYFSIDTNGYGKKPNRMGYDVFTFYVDGKDKVQPLKAASSANSTCEDSENPDACTMSYPCSKVNTNTQSGMGCAWYAVNDINPDNENETYWDNL